MSLIANIKTMIQRRPVTELSCQQVADLLGSERVHVLDTNPRRRWVVAHLPKAKNLDPAGFSETDLPADKQSTLVFYCSDTSCGASRYAARRALEMGFEKACIMPAGITGWLASGFPTEQSES